MKKPDQEIIIKNGHILTVDSKSTTIANGFIRVIGNTIVEIKDGKPPAPDENSQVKIIDAGGGIVMPGMINTHTHIAMSLFRSLGDDRADRLRTLLFPLEKLTVTPEIVYWASLHTLVELIQGGVTCFADMYYFENLVAEATELSGLRAILGETVLDFSAPDAPMPYGGLELAADLIKKYGNHPLITPAVAPHAPYSLDAEHLKLCGRLSQETDSPLLIHLAEMPFEIERIWEDFGMTPVAWMDSLGLVNHHLLAAHCIFVDRDDMALLAHGDAGIAHNMVANIKSGKGAAPVPDMLKRGLRVGLGTDGPMSGNTMDIIGQMGYVGKVQKLIHTSPTIMPARTVVEMATMGGARALHMEDIIGSLEQGKRADIVIISTESVTTFPVYDPWSVLVYGASPRDVSAVIVDGKVLMENRLITGLDLAEIRRSVHLLSENVRKIAGIIMTS